MQRWLIGSIELIIDRKRRRIRFALLRGFVGVGELNDFPYARKYCVFQLEKDWTYLSYFTDSYWFMHDCLR